MFANRANPSHVIGTWVVVGKSAKKRFVVFKVEVTPGSFITDYTDSALIHRSVVEDLNAQITVSRIF